MFRSPIEIWQENPHALIQTIVTIVCQNQTEITTKIIQHITPNHFTQF